MKTALLVEDNQDNRYLLKILLEDNGYRVFEAETGSKGVEMAARIKPNFIIIDIQLPDINGYEATRRIRSSPSDGGALIVAVTSYAMIGDREKVLKAGCAGYIEKPINSDTFVMQFENIIRKKT
jgi:two-component system cell cycle response regulator DivK